MTSAVEIATKTVGGVVSVASVRDIVDGGTTYSVSYTSRASYWLSRHRFDEADRAEAAAHILADFLGAEVRL